MRWEDDDSPFLVWVGRSLRRFEFPVETRRRFSFSRAYTGMEVTTELGTPFVSVAWAKGTGIIAIWMSFDMRELCFVGGCEDVMGGRLRVRVDIP